MEFVIKNLMETIVQSKLNELIESVDCCKCDKCRMDITAYVLNRLPAKYVSTEKGAMLAELDLLNDQHDADVMMNVLQAIELIAKNPHHWTPEEAMENGIKKKTDVAKVSMPVQQNIQQNRNFPQMSQIPMQQPMRQPMQQPMRQPIGQPMGQAIPTVNSMQPNRINAEKSSEPSALSMLSKAAKKIDKKEENKAAVTENQDTKKYKDAADVLEHITTQPPKKVEEHTVSEPLLIEEETYSSSDWDLPIK